MSYRGCHDDCSSLLINVAVTSYNANTMTLSLSSYCAGQKPARTILLAESTEVCGVTATERAYCAISYPIACSWQYTTLSYSYTAYQDYIRIILVSSLRLTLGIGVQSTVQDPRRIITGCLVQDTHNDIIMILIQIDCFRVVFHLDSRKLKTLMMKHSSN